MKATEVLLGTNGLGAVIELAGEDAPEIELFRKLFGARLSQILAVDPQPMVVHATDLLDKGDIRNGEQSWVLGWTQFWMTTQQYLSEFAPKFVGQPGFKNHRTSNEADFALWTVLAMGLDPVRNVPDAMLYVKPDADLRKRIRVAAAGGTLGSEFPLSMHVWLAADEETRRVTGYETPERWSLDMVRNQGTKAARIDKAVALAAEGNSVFQFENMNAVFAHVDVKAEFERRLESALRSPEKMREIVLAAPETMIKESPFVKPLLARPESREAVLKSLGAADVEVMLADKEVRLAAATKIRADDAKEQAFRPRAREILLSEVADEKVVDFVMNNPANDFSHGDESKVRELGKQTKTIMLAGAAGTAAGTVAGQTTSHAQDGPGSAANEPKIDLKAERAMLNRSVA